MTDQAGNKGRPLPPFPTDDFTLDQLEHAMNTCVGGPITVPFNDDAENAPRELIGGEFMLPGFLDVMSGRDPSRAILVGHASDIPIYESWDAHYSEHDVIQALIRCIRELRGKGKGH